MSIIQVKVDTALLQKVIKKLGCREDTPAVYVVDQALRNWLDAK